ncbi:putative Agenet-like domain-containing protein [Helianthus annuus]|nr:putative Agenet-like domain-containing protein [Helianthus annuus]KAJ0762013.1 putative Agenet-like domain-containing protein [Helianthus annuus]
MDNNPTSLSFLTKGSKVEVSSTQDDSTGAWYVATVIHPPPSIIAPNHHTRNNLVYVEYHNLLSDDGSSTRLREYANISYVRPSPLPDSNPPNFQLYDVVEAFYRDGWWTGVVTGVVDTCKFVVGFENPSGEVEFRGSELRLHKKWVGGKWVQQPHKQVTAGWMFTVGKKVEVSFEKESLRDVWFPATVLKNSGNSTFLVEYRQPGAGDEGVLQKVTVDYHHIRPSPPHLRDKNFVLLEKVDAYYDFGWWCGVITKSLADNRYNVFFKHTKKEQEFIYSRVRPHMEWKGGKWFSTSQGDAAVRTPHSLIDNKIEQAAPIIGKQSSVATSVTKSEHQKNLDSNDKTSPNDETMNDDSVRKKKHTSVGQSDGVDSEVSGMTDQGFSKKGGTADIPIEQATSIIGKQSPVATSILTRKRQKNLDSSDKTSPNDEIMNDDSSKKEKHPSVGQLEGVDSEVSEMTDQAFSKTENLSHGKKVQSKRGKSIEPKVPTTCSSKKKGKGSRLINELKSLQTLTDGSEVDLVKPRTRASVEQEDATDDFVFVVMGLQCNKMTVSQEEMVQNLPDENNQDVAKSDTTQPDVPLAVAPLTEVDQEGNEGNVASVALKRKRGRPFKSQALSPKTPATVDHEIRNVVPSTLSVVEDGQRREVDLTTSSETKSLEENQGPVNEQPVAEKQNESLVKDKLPNENNTDLHVQEGTQTKRYPARKRKQAKRRTISINAKSPAQDSRDASKEKADGSLEKNSTTEASVGVDSLVTEGTVEQSSKASEGWLTSGNFPFIRSTTLWKTLESMDAFRMLPQKPHFRPLLEGVREGAQEGLAIGTMVTFSTMFDKTRSLRLDDPRSAIGDCLETLVELENNGFDVKALRERLTGLLLIKDKQEGLKEKSKGFVEKLEEDKTDGKRIEEEMEEINRQMRELEERRKQAMLKKEKRLSELRVMETVIDGIKQEIREVEAEFDELAAAPFVV